MVRALFFSLLFFFAQFAVAQIDEDDLGAWYMYIWNTQLNDSNFGFQGDVQYRNFDILGDLEQLLLRGGVTISPKDSPAKFTLGYANITTGTFGDDDTTSGESRIYQEALLPHKLSDRFRLTHRFRYEQRFVEDQDFRTRYRYALFLTIPFNQEATLNKGDWYLAAYDELFINGQRDIADNRTVELFDRNRLYSALGYVLSPSVKLQAGFMEQSTDNISKGQLQFNVIHSF
ncbi:MAG: DUF2490 domain-containing protein [Saprospiraceae bacterium]|nr:DUF2490 domain-containing protein [Saprospiraceae bacterium]